MSLDDEEKYYAYNAGLPCKNKHCKSYGKPHPNCRCYSGGGHEEGYAKGGEVEDYCSHGKAHLEGCEYFQDGGAAGDLPPGYELEQTPEPPPVAAPMPAPAILPEMAPVEPRGVIDGLPEKPKAKLEPTDIPEGYTLEGASQDLPKGYELESDLPPGYELESDKYKTTEQKVMTGAEGALQGLLGAAAPAIIKHNPLVSPEYSEDISYAAQKGRKEENPEIYSAAETAGVIGGLLTGVGVPGLINEASKKAGSKAIQMAIQGGLLQANDEVSKWILGEGSPVDAVGAATSVGAAGLLGGLMGGAVKPVKAAAQTVADKVASANLGKFAESFLTGLGQAAETADPAIRRINAEMAKNAGMNMKAFKSAQILVDKWTAPLAAASIGAYSGYHDEGVWGGIKGLVEGASIGWGARKVGKYAGPAILKILSSGHVEGASEAIDHAGRLVSGNKVMSEMVDDLFKVGLGGGQQAIKEYGSKALRDDLDTFIGRGGINQSIEQEGYEHTAPDQLGYAEGGEVNAKKKPKPILHHDSGAAMHYPEQNMLLNTAKSRVSNYLSGLRPQPNQPQLPFDDAPDDREKRKTYDRALDIAATPLGVMREVAQGTLEPEHVQHLNAMYPELNGLLQRKLTEKVVQAQVDGKKPSYKLRQGLSLLMGAPLSSELTPQSVQAAQSVFAKQGRRKQKEDEGGGDKKPANSKATLTKASQAFLTGPQALQKRSQRS